VAQFLVDSFPGALEGPLPEAALQRARINFFVDSFFNKVQTHFYPLVPAYVAGAEGDASKAKEAEELSALLVAAVKKELEPLLKNTSAAAPFFGGSKKLTLAEVQTGSFLLRFFGLSNQGLLPKSLLEGLSGLENFDRWARATVAEKSVNYIWDEENVAAKTKARVLKSLQTSKV
jgi:glutathione S-transferase